LNYTFQTWSDGNLSFTRPVTVNQATQTLTAIFTGVTHNITTASFPAIGGTTTGGGAYAAGASVTVTATPASGYVFVNWTENANEVSATESYQFTASGDRSLVANFDECTLTLAVDPQESGTATITSGNAKGACNRSVTVLATAKSNYTFDKWSDGNTSASRTVTVTQRTQSLTATFTGVTHNITTASNPAIGGSTTGAGAYATGASVTVTATPANGYSFVNWTENGSQVSPTASYQFTASANRSLVANFLLSCTLTLSQTTGGTIGLTHGTATGGCGRSVTVTATPAAGYGFAGWSDGALGTSNPVTFPLAQDKTLAAVFGQVQVAVDAIASCVLAASCSTAIEQAQRVQIDALGNKNGYVDIGDLLAMLDRQLGAISADKLRAILSAPGARALRIPVRRQPD
jgi:hypothetical protein